MNHHHLRRFRTRHSGAPSRWKRLHAAGGTILVVIAGLVTTAVLVGALRRLEFEQNYKSRKAYWDSHFVEMEAIDRHWKAVPPLGPVRSGDEPHVARFLSEQPLVVAVLDRSPGRILWVREGDRLIRPRDQAAAEQLSRWTSQAEAARGPEWLPPQEQDPDFGKAVTVVMASDQWLLVKRWRPGTPEVEQALRVALGPTPSSRAGLVRTSDLVRWGDPVPSGQPKPWAMEPNLQADAYSYNTTLQRTEARSSSFGSGWTIVTIAFAAQEKVLHDKFRMTWWTAIGAGVLVDLAIALGLWLQHRARRHAVMEGDRIASMTHSLKTPLALLKLRCDSLRLGHLSPERASEELIRVGDEVDELSAIIEHALLAVRGGGSVGARGVATDDWFQAVAGELQPYFDMEGRALELKLGPDAGHASLASLRAAVLTLLENALGHGGGRVTLETWRAWRRVCIRVKDEGEGLAPHQLKVLGKPFQRIRERGKEGFMREGLGLGLSLLAQVAEQEGWGLTLSSGRGKGFMATLEIPAS